MESLLFHFLDDWLFKFSADLFFIPRVMGKPWHYISCDLNIFCFPTSLSVVLQEVKVLNVDRMRWKIRSIG